MYILIHVCVQRVHMHNLRVKENIWRTIVHMILKANNSHGLQLASWQARTAAGMNPILV